VNREVDAQRPEGLALRGTTVPYRSFPKEGKECETMKVTPLQDRVVIKRLEEEDTTKGGIIIPDAAKEKPQEGRVVAVGAGRMTEKGQRVPPEVKVGNKILFGKYSGTDIKIDGEEHLILKEEDILAIIED
jgi:chaperonin GroES